MRNFSKVYLKTHTRQDFHFTSVEEIKKNIEDIGYVDTIFYIPADAKMDGL